jgi:hypothetical protein
VALLLEPLIGHSTGRRNLHASGSP